MWKTRKDFELDLYASYRRAKFHPGKKQFPVGAALVRVGAKQKSKPPKNVTTALGVLDDLILDAVMWHHSFAILLMNAKVPPRQRSLRRALMALSRRVAQDAMVVRRLICEGYDVQARNLLRSLDEHLGAIYYLCLKPGACSKFIAAQTEKSANKFWWAHIRGSRKVVEDALSKIVGPEFVQEMSIFRRSEWSMLSSAHHPSYAACTVPFMVPYSDVNASKYIFGAPSEYSYRTGKLLYYMLAEAALFIGALNKDIGGLIKRKRGPALQAFVRRGQLHLVTMLLQLAANWRCPLFDASSEMNALWKNVKHQRIRRAARLKKVRASRQVNLEMVRSMG